METLGASQDQMDIALTALGETLQRRQGAVQLVIVGGANLLLRGVIARPTKDADVLAQRLEDGKIVPIDRLPAVVEEAVADVADAYGLAPDWLNIGPRSLMDLGLPEGFEDRIVPRRYGALTLWLAGEFDMVCFKLYAAADHWPTKDRHLKDLQALEPTHDTLVQAAAWCVTHDPSPAFHDQLRAVLISLGVDIGHG